MLGLLMKNWKLRVWCSLFLFFMWFARFQILIFEPQSIRHKLLLLSWLYKEIWSYLKISMNDYQENPWLWADLFIRKSGVSEVNVCLEKSELKLEKKNFTLDYLSSQTNVLSSLCGVFQAKFVRWKPTRVISYMKVGASLRFYRVFKLDLREIKHLLGHQKCISKP